MDETEHDQILDLKNELEKNKFQILKQNVELDDFFNNSPCGYINLSTEGKVLKANVTFLDWIGYSRKEILSFGGLINLVEEKSKNSFLSNFDSILNGKIINNLEITLKKK
ncbi:MAG: hypothetical protein SFU98_13995 [Leptospiraceae bacterium]|nr:hypothetical protein [Leptospiraceae bacterium]